MFSYVDSAEPLATSCLGKKTLFVRYSNVLNRLYLAVRVYCMIHKGNIVRRRLELLAERRTDGYRCCKAHASRRPGFALHNWHKDATTSASKFSVHSRLPSPTAIGSKVFGFRMPAFMCYFPTAVREHVDKIGLQQKCFCHHDMLHIVELCSRLTFVLWKGLCFPCPTNSLPQSGTYRVSI